VLFAIIAAAESDPGGNGFFEGKSKLIVTLTSLLFVTAPEAFGTNIRKKVPRLPHRRSKKCRVWQIFQELGPTYIRWAYCMDKYSFYKLHHMLKKYMTKRRHANNKRKKNSGKNGTISSVVRLHVAICYFAGGDTYNISIAHGILHTEVFWSIWCVVDAVNKYPELSFKS
jgi:hypothetical protein